MTTRTLPRNEWPRLAGTELGACLEALPPDTEILVVEDAGRIVGTWAVIRYVHVEGIWIDPAYRQHGAVARRLLRAMRATAAAFGVQAVLTAALTDQVRGLIRRLGGVPLPGDHFVLPVHRS